MDIQELKYDFDAIKRKLERLKAEKLLLEIQLNREQDKLIQIDNDLDLYNKVQILLQKVSDYARNYVKARIEEIVTQALKVIFNQNYSFRITLIERANRVECDYYLYDGKIETKLEKPDYDRGGGIVDGVSLALFLALNELTGNKGPVLMDEVGKHISKEYAPNVAYFLKVYAERFNKQIVLITHNDELAQIGNTAIKVRKTAGKSEVIQ